MHPLSLGGGLVILPREEWILLRSHEGNLFATVKLNLFVGEVFVCNSKA